MTQSLTPNKEYNTRSNFVTAVGGGLTAANGYVVTAGGFSYVADSSYNGISDLPGWRPFGTHYLEHWGITTTSSKLNATTDYTTKVQAAMNNTVGELVFTGWVKIKDKIVCPNTCRPNVPAGRAYGGFSIRSDFNMNATCVFQPGTSEAGATIGDFGMWFEQPSSPSSRNDLYKYPIAFNIGYPGGESAVTGDPSVYDGIARGYAMSLRIEQAWDGIIGVGNCGGYRFGVIELGCFNRNFYVDGAKDFIHAESIHVWPFGFSGTTALKNIFYDGATIGGRLGRVDNWVCDKYSVYRTKIILEDTNSDSRLPYQFGAIGLDGNDALIELKNGSSQISKLYSTKTANAPGTERDIVCTGGSHIVSNLFMTSSSDASVLCAGGYLKISSGDVEHLNNGRRAFISQGTGVLDVSNVAMAWSNNSNRTAPFMEQQSGSVLRVSNCHAKGNYSNPQELIKYNSDEEGNLLNCPDLYPHTANFNTYWTEGVYDDGTLIVLKPYGSEGAELRFTNKNSATKFYIDVDGGGRLRFRNSSGVMVQFLNNGQMQMPGIPEYANDSAAASGGISVGSFYVNSSNGALTKRMS